MFLEIITENANYEEASLEDLQTWEEDFGLTMPVLSDPGSSTMWSFASGSVGLPFTVLLDRGVVVQESVGTASLSQMDELLAE